MHLIGNLFHVALYQPLFNGLIFLYNLLPGHDFGLAVILLTLIIKFLLYPLGVQAIKSQKVMQEIQPKIKEINEKYKDSPQERARATMDLYKTAKINPFSGILGLFIQIPILIALYQVFWKGLNPDGLLNLYSFVANPGVIDPTFLNFIDLSKSNIVLALLSGVLQYWQTKMMMPKNKKSVTKSGPDFSSMMQKQMLYFFPIFTVFILWKLPSAIGLYWVVTSIFTIVQQYLISKKENVQQK